MVIISLRLVVLVVLVGLHASLLDLEQVELVLLIANPRRAVAALAPTAVVVVLRLETRTQCHLQSSQSSSLKVVLLYMINWSDWGASALRCYYGLLAYLLY